MRNKFHSSWKRSCSMIKIQRLHMNQQFYKYCSFMNFELFINFLDIRIDYWSLIIDHHYRYYHKQAA